MIEPGISSLPDPEPFALEHSNRLRELLLSRIAQSSVPFTFANYMTHALYEPGLGYYMAGAAKFGAAGDFITAPEVSPLYGAALGVQVLEILDRIDGGVLELGAGSGKLAAGLLQSIGCTRPIPYTILEPSAELALRQQRYLSDTLHASQFAALSWVSTLPKNFSGVVIANEVMDALSVERFSLRSGVQQICVSEGLSPYSVPASAPLEEAVRALEADRGEPFPAGYTSELCLLLRPWLTSVRDAVSSGVLLLVDYGYPRREYYLNERDRGTLACYYRHRVHDDPFHLPGLQDITAHVDFTRVAESAVALDMSLLGYSSQASFLIDNDLLPLLEKSMAASKCERDRIVLSRGVKTLTLPGEMGERFQVMALGKDYDLPLRGFQSQDLSHRL